MIVSFFSNHQPQSGMLPQFPEPIESLTLPLPPNQSQSAIGTTINWLDTDIDLRRFITGEQAKALVGGGFVCGGIRDSTLNLNALLRQYYHEHGINDVKVTLKVYVTLMAIESLARAGQLYFKEPFKFPFGSKLIAISDDKALIHADDTLYDEFGEDHYTHSSHLRLGAIALTLRDFMLELKRHALLEPNHNFNSLLDTLCKLPIDRAPHVPESKL